MPRNGRCTGPRNPARARSRYAKAVDEAIRRAAADGTRTGNFHSNSPAVVRSVSTEAAVRFHRYRKGPFFGYDIANGPLFLTTPFRFASFPTPKCALCLKAKFSDKFGQKLRLTAQCPTCSRCSECLTLRRAMIQARDACI